ALADLKITLPVATGGPADVTVSLVAVDGSVLAEVRTILIVGSSLRSNRPPPSGAPAPAVEAGAPQPLSAGRPERGPRQRRRQRPLGRPPIENGPCSS